MPTIQEIQNQLLTYSASGNASLFSNTLASITTEQKPLITVYSQTLWNLSYLQDMTTSSSMTRSMMQIVGSYIHGADLTNAMVTYSSNGNFAALDALTDYLTAEQKTQIGSAYPNFIQTLNNIAYHDDTYTTADDINIANVTRDFMSKLGTQIYGADLTNAMVTYSSNGNFAALDALTDYLTAEQKTQIGSAYPNFIQTLNNIAYHDDTYTTADDINIANVTRDFMSKLGAQVTIQDIGHTAEFFANTHNVNAVDAVIGEIPTSKFNAVLLGMIAPELNAEGIVLGSQSANTFNGTVNADKYLGLWGDDTLYGNDGHDYLFGDAGNDKLYGGNGNDLLHGGSGNDMIYGDTGNDVIFGGKGSDILYGGSGADTIRFETADHNSGADIIKDYSVVQGDIIDISDVLIQYDAITNAISDFVKLTTSGTNTLLQIDVDGSASAHGFSTFATLENVTNLDLTTLVADGHIKV